MRIEVSAEDIQQADGAGGWDVPAPQCVIERAVSRAVGGTVRWGYAYGSYRTDDGTFHQVEVAGTDRDKVLAAIFENDSRLRGERRTKPFTFELIENA